MPGLCSKPLSRVNLANLAAYVINIAVTYASLTGIFGETNTVLSKKYQTLVTPVGWAFSIWGPIFIWEAVFAIAQMLPKYRESEIVHAVCPYWCLACSFQVAWSIAFGADLILPAFVCMLGILVSLFCSMWVADQLTDAALLEFWLLRAPFSLHAGWIVAASAVNFNVLADSRMADASTLLALAVVSFGIILAVAALASVAWPKPDSIICFVAAWALAGVAAELNDPVNLQGASRFNPHLWDVTTLDGIKRAASYLSVLAVSLAVVAMALRFHLLRRIWSSTCRLGATAQKMRAGEGNPQADADLRA